MQASALTATELTNSPNQVLGVWKNGGELEKNEGSWREMGGNGEKWGELEENGGKWRKMGGGWRKMGGMGVHE